MLLEIDFLSFADSLNIKKEEGKRKVWDSIRKKWLVLTPEEFVRQLVVAYCIEELGYSKNRIKIEKSLKVNTLEKRCDVLIYDEETQPLILIECKRPEVKLDQKVFDQISRYNIALRVPFLWVTNGPESYFCKVDFEAGDYRFLSGVEVEKTS